MLITWPRTDEGNLVGEIELPLAVGIVGGATRVHPAAQAALKLLGVQSARDLALRNTTTPSSSSWAPVVIAAA